MEKAANSNSADGKRVSGCRIKNMIGSKCDKCSIWKFQSLLTVKVQYKGRKKGRGM